MSELGHKVDSQIPDAFLLSSVKDLSLIRKCKKKKPPKKTPNTTNPRKLLFFMSSNKINPVTKE